MILRTVVEEIIDGESPDFGSSFLVIVQVQLKGWSTTGVSSEHTGEDDVDLTDETCVRLSPDAESDVKTEDMELDE